MEYVVLWIAGAVIAGVIADRKGRSGGLLALLALVASPIVGIGVALVLAPNQKRLDEAALRGGTMRRCPQCAELVRAEAVCCRYCQANLSTPGAGEDQSDRAAYELGERLAKRVKGQG